MMMSVAMATMMMTMLMTMPMPMLIPMLVLNSPIVLKHRCITCVQLFTLQLLALTVGKPELKCTFLLHDTS